MLHNPLPPVWPHQQSHHPHSHGASPASRARHGARWHPYDSGNGGNGTGVLVGGNAENSERSASPGVKRRLQINIPKASCTRTRSLTDIHSSGALAPSPLRNCAVYDEAGLPVRVGQVYEPLPETMQVPGTKQEPYHHYALPYPHSAYAQTIQTPSTARQGYLHTPPTISSRSSSHFGSVASTAMNTPATSIMVTPASAISPISPIRERFNLPMTHAHWGVGEGAAREFEQRRQGEEEEDARTEVGSPEMAGDDGPVGAYVPMDLRLPPIRTLPRPVMSYGAVAQQTRRAMRPSAVSQDVLLYGPAGVTPAPAELARINANDKIPPIPNHLPPRQATFFGIQNMPIADGSGRFATICAPGMRPMPSRPVYPPAGMAPLIAGHQGLPHGGLTAPIECGEKVQEWKESQRAKERADVVVKDGEFTVAERLEMEKRITMSVKVINHIYYGADDVPKTRSPTQLARRLADEDEPANEAGPSTLSARPAKGSYWPPTPSSMPSSPESPKTRRERQRASMRKDVFGERANSKVASQKSELEEMVRSIGSPGLEVEEPEEEAEADPTREPPARTLTWFVTEVLRRSRTSINVLQVALAYLAGAKPEIHNQLRIAADRQAELAMQIAELPQHVRDMLPSMDWLGSEFTPSPLIDPRRTFLASLVLASKFLLDKAFSNKAWAKLSGLEALEVGKCERALGTALNWRLWVGREASRECIAPAQHTVHHLSPAQTMSPPIGYARGRSGVWEHPTLGGLQDDSLTRPSSPLSVGAGSFLSISTPNMSTGSDSGASYGYDDSQWTQTHTPEMVQVDELLHGSPSGHPSTVVADQTFSSDAAAYTRPTLPSIRSFDRPVLRRGPSELVTPQTDSNMGGCIHLPPVCFDRASAHESPLAYADFARPWEAVQQPHWDFSQDGVVGA